MFVFFFSSRRRHTRCALVTGVQTCALPILKHPIGRDRFAFSLNWAEFGPPPRRLISLQIETDLLPETFIPAIAAIPLELPFKSSRNGRSEARRVGQECGSTGRSRWSSYHSKKKNTHKLK